MSPAHAEGDVQKPVLPGRKIDSLLREHIRGGQRGVTATRGNSSVPLHVFIAGSTCMRKKRS